MGVSGALDQHILGVWRSLDSGTTEGRVVLIIEYTPNAGRIVRGP